MSRVQKQTVRYLVFSLSCFVAWAGPWTGILHSAEPRVTAEVTPERIYAGESVRYRVTLQNCDATVEPELDHFLDFETRLLGKTTGSQATVILNGQVQSFSRSGPSFEYMLTPKRSGKIVIPAVRIEVEGKHYQGPVLRLEVIEPGEQDVVILQLLADPADVYPLQPFTLKLNVAVKALPEPVGDREPVTVQQNLPQLVLPWADDDSLPQGVKPQEPAAEWLRSMLDTSRRPSGFAINSIRTRGTARFPDMNDLLGDNGFPNADSLFSMLREEGRAPFHPAPQKTTRRDLKERRVGYWEYSFDRTLTSEKLGECNFGPATLKGMFATRANTQGDLEGERIYAVSKAISVRVNDAPLAGRPPDYLGAIGEFEAGAELNPTQVKVGDPMTLNVWLKGTGTLANITAPNLAANAAISANFKIYEATDQTTDEERRFTFSLRPKQADLREFPAIAISYFDVKQEKYVSLQTKPIPITVAATDQLASTDIALPASTTNDLQSPEARVEGVFANITELSQVRNETIRPRRYAVLLSSLMGAFLATVLVTKSVRKSKADVSGQKRRNAARRARERLKEGVANSVPDTQSAEAISSALRGLVADWIGESEQSLTTGDVRRNLTNRQIEPSVIEMLVAVLEDCDAARYGAGSVSIGRIAERAEAVIQAFDAEFRKRLS